MAKKPEAAVEQTAVTPVGEVVTETPVVEAPATDAPAETVDDGKVEIKLVGTAAEKSGTHEHWFDNIKHVVFHDGVARVEAEIAKLLKELGIVE